MRYTIKSWFLLCMLILGLHCQVSNAGVRQVRFKASDPRSHSAQGRLAITTEHISEAIKRNVIIKYISSIVYAKNIEESEKIKKITEMVPLFDMSLAQLEEYKKTKEKKTKEAIVACSQLEKKVKSAQKKVQEIEKKAYSSQTQKNKELQKAKEELAQANVQWSTKKKLLVGLVGGTVAVGTALALAGFAGVAVPGAAAAVTAVNGVTAGIGAVASAVGGATSSLVSTAMSVGSWVRKGISVFGFVQDVMKQSGAPVLEEKQEA